MIKRNQFGILKGSGINDTIHCIRTKFIHHIEFCKDNSYVYYLFPILKDDGNVLDYREMYCSVSYQSHNKYDLSWYFKCNGTKTISFTNTETYFMVWDHELGIDSWWEFSPSIIPGHNVLEYFNMEPEDFEVLQEVNRVVLDISKKIQETP